MDCLFLSYADPALAAEVMLGHFESAPHPQQPCMREDGSYNMVADDGQLCGTAPEWGYPLWCCDQLFRRTGDMHWLGRLYPKAAAYLRWWLEIGAMLRGGLSMPAHGRAARMSQAVLGRNKRVARSFSMCAPWICRRVSH